MEAETAALLTTAGTTVVALMATDAWKQARDGLVRLWRRFRPEQAEAIDGELSAARTVITTMQVGASVEPEAVLSSLWARELRELLADPRAAQELRALLLTFEQTMSADGRLAPRSQRVEAKAKGRARSYAAGGNMTIIEGPGRE